MEELALTSSLAAMLIIALICIIIFKKLKLPAIVGYLATGIFLANYWSNYDDTTTELIVGLLSNLGLALLMFSIGMELNFEKLRRNGVFAVIVVLVQVPIVLLAGSLFGSMLGWNPVLSISMGAILAGSSTAVVIVVQNERKVLDTESVDTLLLILVVEDVAQVVMMSVLTPMMSSGNMVFTDVLILIAKILAFMIVATYVGIRFFPRILNWVGDRMNDEVLNVAALASCFFLAFLSVKVGMSMAVGAFLMGVIVSQCNHSHKIEHNLAPMKDIFMAMFFISIGLEVHPDELLQNIPLMLEIFLLFLVSRTIAIYLGFLIGNKEPRLSFISATSLLTMGEFAFIISEMAHSAGVMSDGVHAAVIGAALISMITQSFITGASGKVFDKVSSVMPSPVRVLNSKILMLRDAAYVKFGQLSVNAKVGVKKLALFIYFSGFILFILIAMFYYFGSEMAMYLEKYIDPINSYSSKLIVRLFMFMVLLVPLSVFVSNIKSIFRLVSKAESWENFDTRKDYESRVGSVNLWIPSIFLDFLILLIIPSNLALFDHLLISAVGIAIFALMWVVSIMRKPSAVDETE